MDYRELARNFVRTLRGRRSQVALSRLLGFRSNVLAKWEAGRRTPSALAIFRACSKLGLDVPAAFSNFQPSTSALVEQISGASLAQWLTAQKGSQPLTEIARSSGLSRYQVTRCLSGATSPTLPAFFALVNAMTGRLPEFVAEFVGLERMPALQDVFIMQEQARTCAYNHPWSSAVLAVLDTRSGEMEASRAEIIATVSMRLGIEASVAEESVLALRRAGVLNANMEVVAPLTTNTRNDPKKAAQLRRHWAEVGSRRLAEPSKDDLFSFNVFSVNQKDYEEIARLQIAFYRRVQALVRESKSVDRAVLMNLHLVSW